MLATIPRPYDLLRRVGFFVARFFGAAGNLGLIRAIRLYAWDFWRDGDCSVRVPVLDTTLHFRGRHDYLVTALLFHEDFYVQPNGFEVRTVLDLGANIGIETLRFARFYPNAKIIAVEADKEHHRVLQENTTAFARVTALHAAAWGSKSSFQIQRVPTSFMSSSVSETANGDIRGVTIAELIDQLGVMELDILKIDVEGAEDSLFGPSMAEWIKRVRIIVWELNDHEVPRALTRLVLAMEAAKVSFNFHIRGEKLIAVRSDTSVNVLYPCGLLSRRVVERVDH